MQQTLAYPNYRHSLAQTHTLLRICFASFQTFVTSRLQTTSTSLPSAVAKHLPSCRQGTGTSKPVSQSAATSQAPVSSSVTPPQQRSHTAAASPAHGIPAASVPSLSVTVEQAAAEIQPQAEASASLHSSRAQSSELSVKGLQVSLLPANALYPG